MAQNFHFRKRLANYAVCACLSHAPSCQDTCRRRPRRSLLSSATSLTSSSATIFARQGQQIIIPAAANQTQLGQVVGPINDNTRSTYERIYADKLAKAGDEINQAEAEPTPVKKQAAATPKASVKKTGALMALSCNTCSSLLVTRTPAKETVDEPEEPAASSALFSPVGDPAVW